MDLDKIHRNAVKLYGISSDDCKFNDCLDALDKSKLVDPYDMKSLVFDHSVDSYVLFLRDIVTTRRLLGQRLTIKNKDITILPLLDFFIIRDVFPSVTKADLETIFSHFGPVFEVVEIPLLPGKPEMAHILSGEREISFLLLKDNTGVNVPTPVFVPPYKFNVTRLCTFCLKEGHSIFVCPREFKDAREPKREEMPDVKIKKEEIIDCLVIDDEDDDLLTEFNEKISRTPSPTYKQENTEEKGFPDRGDYYTVLYFANKCNGILEPESFVKLFQKQVNVKQDLLDILGDRPSLDLSAVQRQLLLFNKRLYSPEEDGCFSMNERLLGFLRSRLPGLIAAVTC